MSVSIRMPARRVSVAGAYDVIVAGGGPAGVGAAVAAARHGAKVLLIEQTGALGGMATSGLVPCFAPFSWQNPTDENPVSTGIVTEVAARLHELGGTNLGTWPYLDAEKLKFVYDQLVAEAGVHVLFFSVVTDVVVQRGRITAVLVANKAGAQAFRGKVFIDGTGDADLAARAGVPFEQGDAKHRVQGCTVCFTVAGVDTDAYWKFVRRRFTPNARMTAWLRENCAKGHLPKIPGAEYSVIAQKTLHAGTVAYNFGHVFGLDGTNPADLTRGITVGRRIAHAYLAFARRRIAGMANAHLSATGALLGVRETRRIKGRFQVTVDDFRNSRHWVDDIALCDYPVDIHASTFSNTGVEKTNHLMDVLRQPPGETYGIPFGALVPKRIANLLVAGRSVSCDRWVQGSLRVMPVCLATGQAAGTAAAQAVRSGSDVAGVDIAKLQRTLAHDGVRLE